MKERGPGACALSLPTCDTPTDDIIQQLKTFGQVHGPAILLAVVAVLALFLALKAVKFFFKLFFVLVALAALGGVVWWFFIRNGVPAQ